MPAGSIQGFPRCFLDLAVLRPIMSRYLQRQSDRRPRPVHEHVVSAVRAIKRGHRAVHPLPSSTAPGLILNSSGPLLSAAQILGRLQWAELSSSRTKATRDTCEGKRANSQSRRMMWGAPSLQTGVSTPRRRSKAVKGTGAIDVDRDCSGGPFYPNDRAWIASICHK